MFHVPERARRSFTLHVARSYLEYLQSAGLKGRTVSEVADMTTDPREHLSPLSEGATLQENESGMVTGLKLATNPLAASS